MDLDFEARSGRSRRHGFRLALAAAVLVGGVTIVNLTLSAGAQSVESTETRAGGTPPGGDRQSITIGLPDATSSAAAMQTARLPVRQSERQAAPEDAAPTLASIDQTPPMDTPDAESKEPKPPDVMIPAPDPRQAALDSETSASAVADDQPATPASTGATNKVDPATPESEGADDVDTGEAETPQRDWRKLEVRSGDSLARVLHRADLGPQTVRAVVGSHERAKQLRQLYPGDVIELNLSSKGRLQDLRYKLSDSETLHVTRERSNYSASIVANELERRVAHKSAVIRSSLFDAGNQVGLSDDLLMQLANIFRWDIDFALDIRSGDAFTVVYETFYRDGNKVRNGDILAAEFVNRGESFRAVRYANSAQQADYYDPEGHSMRKAFLRTPVDFTRVSSGFDPERMHPTLGEKRAHMGTDYAASPGTPIKATGDGKVVHRGWKGGYGRTLVLRHAGRYTTLYAHMSGYRNDLDAGDRVRQGQTIGYVGSSGRSTGPHLHYEFRVNGTHRNPRTVDLPDAQPIPDDLRQDFQAQTQPRLAQLALYSRFRLAAQGEFLP